MNIKRKIAILPEFGEPSAYTFLITGVAIIIISPPV
jgi:hypothetical protein